MSEKIPFKVEIDPTGGFTIEGIDNYTANEMFLIMKNLSGIVRTMKEEHKRRRIIRKCMELEAKTVWSARETAWYMFNAPKVGYDNAFNTAVENFEAFRERMEAD